MSAAATQERKKLSINQNIYTGMEQKKTTMNLKSEVIHKFTFKSPERYSREFLAGVYRPVLQILTRFQTKKCNFLHLISNKNSY